MLTIFLRTIIIYIILILIMHLLGKRQLGELEISELITTILISEVASLPLTNQDIPLIYAIIPLITISFFEIASSLCTALFPKIKNFVTSRPSILINKGRVIESELIKNRISPEELISELRIKNIPDISAVQYAILEQNGMLSVCEKASEQKPAMKDMKIVAEEKGITHIIISNGEWDEYNLKRLGKTKIGALNFLEKQETKRQDVLLLLIDDNDKFILIKKEVKK